MLSFRACGHGALLCHRLWCVRSVSFYRCLLSTSISSTQCVRCSRNEWQNLKTTATIMAVLVTSWRFRETTVNSAVVDLIVVTNLKTKVSELSARVSGPGLPIGATWLSLLGVNSMSLQGSQLMQLEFKGWPTTVSDLHSAHFLGDLWLFL